MAICLSVVVIVVTAVTFSDGTVIPNWRTLSDCLTISPTPVSEQKGDYFRVIDVGQGDCLLFSSNGQTALIDTGTEEYSANLYPKFRKYGIEKFDLLMVSHLHDDHTGGIDTVSEKFDIKNLIIPKLLSDQEGTDAVNRVRNSVRKKSGAVYTAMQGMSVQVGDFEITVLAYFEDEEDENDRSLFLMAEIDGKRILLTGDAGKSAEKRLLAEGLDLSCDILKVGHHGSSSSSTEALLEACKPKYAAISCGLGNSYSHPHENTLERLEECKAEIYRTDIRGDITFSFEDGRISVSTEK